MILLVGVGHVFDLAEQISFIIKNVWPNAVLVELDEKRYDSLMCGEDHITEKNSTSRLYQKSARYQERVSEENGVKTGEELLAAINAGRLINADIICIDKDAELLMKEIEDNMSVSEKIKYVAYNLKERIFGSRKIKDSQKRFAVNEKEYLKIMRKRFPLLMKKLIDERDKHMAERIKEASDKYEKMVVVVGDAHITGLCSLLEDQRVYNIRLTDLMDKESMDRLRSKIWNGGFE